MSRLDKSRDTMTFEPQFSARNIHYEVSDKTGAISCGGIGVIHMLVKRLGLVEAIDQRLHLLKFHLPYQESDHVLNFAYNALCNGTCLQDMELRRHDENFLNAEEPARNANLLTQREPASKLAAMILLLFGCIDAAIASPVPDIDPGSRATSLASPARCTGKLRSTLMPAPA